LVLGVASTALGLHAQGRAANPSRTDQTITVIGCVQREVDVLRTSPGNLGLANEYVLARSSIKPDASGSSGGSAGSGTRSGTRGRDAVAASGPFGRVYRLTGDKERDLKAQIGKEVEIIGSFDSDADAKLDAERNVAPPAAARTEDRRPASHDVPEILIQSIRPLGNACTGTIVK
jgi:hypothetical protein